jgi:ATP-dependent protease ClpP protease subunit
MAKSASFNVYGVVGDEIRAQAVSDFLDQNKGPVTIRLASGGGWVDEGLAIAQRLIAHPGKVTTIVDSVAASIASLIFVAGSERIAPVGSLLFLHSPWQVTSGNAADLRKQAGALDRICDAMVSIYSRATGLAAERIRELLEAETWMDEAQALASGFATRVEGEADSRALASVRLDHLRLHHVPAALLRLNPAAAAAMLKEIPMTTAEAAGTTAGGNVATLTDAQAAQAAERGRTSEISRLCSLDRVRAALPADFASRAIAEGTSVDNVRAAVITAMADHQDRVQGEIRNFVRVEAGADNSSPTVLASRMQAALASRMSGGRIKCPDDAREFMGAPVPEMARALLDARGERDLRFASRDTVINRAMGSHGFAKTTTSDFPELLAGAGERVLLDVFERTRSEVFRVVSTTTVSDFKEIQRLRRGEAPLLEQVGEAGEVKHGVMSEEAETYRVRTFGKIFSLSRNALINDDLAAFAGILSDLGRAAAATETEELMALLASNAGLGPTMSDGLTWIHSTHSNTLTTGSSLDSGSLAEARTLLRRQKGLTTDNYLNLKPKFLVVPPELESTAISLMSSEILSDNSANPVRNLAEILVEPRLSGTPWYLFAEGPGAETIEIAYLDGSRPSATSSGGPMLETFESASVLGVQYRVVADFGIGAVGYRGVVRATGAA